LVISLGLALSFRRRTLIISIEDILRLSNPLKMSAPMLNAIAFHLLTSPILGPRLLSGTLPFPSSNLILAGAQFTFSSSRLEGGSFARLLCLALSATVNGHGGDLWCPDFEEIYVTL
jgi:hypothetical protein